jgi:hypothetical protein
MEWFRERSKGEEAALVMTRDLGGRGLDFPAAESVLFVSPRSNYQTVAQEIARIRSRAGAVKESRSQRSTFYAESEEQAKTQRLAAYMQAQTFRDANLFELADPPEPVELRDFESRSMAYMLGEEGEHTLPGIGRRCGVVGPQRVIEEGVLRSGIHLEVVRNAGRRQLGLEDGRGLRREVLSGHDPTTGQRRRIASRGLGAAP